jgi:hypothetical protein
MIGLCCLSRQCWGGHGVTKKQGKQDAGRHGGHPLIWLLGQPHLGDYLSFVETRVVGGESMDKRQLADEWRAANDIYASLEASEAGIADTIECLPAGQKRASQIAAVAANPWFRKSFDNLPFSIEKVELDKLIVSQVHVEASYAGEVEAKLRTKGGKCSDRALFDFCLPLDRPSPPVRIQRLSTNRYLFASPSTDFRSHDARLLRGAEIDHLDSSGPVTAMFGVMVGFGSNFMSGIRSGSRVLLQNGYHRAFALRRAGFTHGWCAIETVTRKDELKLTASDEVAEDPEFYFAAKRPPILRDFLDRRLAKPLLVRDMETQLEIEIVIRSSTATLY